MSKFAQSLAQFFVPPPSHSTGLPCPPFPPNPGARSSPGPDFVDPNDPTALAERELLGAANQIEAAARKLALLRPRKSAKVRALPSAAELFSGLGLLPKRKRKRRRKRSGWFGDMLRIWWRVTSPPHAQRISELSCQPADGAMEQEDSRGSTAWLEPASVKESCVCTLAGKDLCWFDLAFMIIVSWLGGRFEPGTLL